MSSCLWIGTIMDVFQLSLKRLVFSCEVDAVTFTVSSVGIPRLFWLRPFTTFHNDLLPGFNCLKKLVPRASKKRDHSVTSCRSVLQQAGGRGF